MAFTWEKRIGLLVLATAQGFARSENFDTD